MTPTRKTRRTMRILDELAGLKPFVDPANPHVVDSSPAGRWNPVSVERFPNDHPHRYPPWNPPVLDTRERYPVTARFPVPTTFLMRIRLPEVY